MAYCYRHPDRETGLSCSECDRPICYECMTPAPVGIRCPEHSGKPQGVQRITRGVKRAGFEGGGAIVTKTLIAINAVVWLTMVATGATISNPGGVIFQKGALIASGVPVQGYLFGTQFAGPGVHLVGVAHGEWWRLITSAFLHASIFHIGMNMFVLWIVGAPIEQALGRGRFILIYFVSALAGSAGALLQSPLLPTLGASGAIFGLFGAAFVLERQGYPVLGGSALSLIVINLALSFVIPNVAIGGHIGGLIGGAAATFALSRFGRGHAAYSRLGMAGIASIVAVGVLSVLVSYWRVRGYA